MPVDELSRVAVSVPTYAEVLVHAAVRAATELRLPLGEQAAHVGQGHCGVNATDHGHTVAKSDARSKSAGTRQF